MFAKTCHTSDEKVLLKWVLVGEMAVIPDKLVSCLFKCSYIHTCKKKGTDSRKDEKNSSTGPKLIYSKNF